MTTKIIQQEFARDRLVNVELSESEYALGLSAEVLQRLIHTGAVHPNELRPLNQKTKQYVKMNCLKACEQRSCHHCIFQKNCGFHA